MTVTVTFGVEEEFLLVDARSRRTVGRADAVLKRVGSGVLPDGATLHRELLSSQVEFASGVCASMGELRAQLAAGRRVLCEAACGEGLGLVSAGTAVLADPDVPVAEGERFDRISAVYAQVFRDYQVSGCHVHIGIPDRDTAVAVINHMSVWLPVLLALSANSPFDRGRDTGYASWRMVQQSRLPGSGLTPWFGSAAEYDQMVARLVDCGVLIDETMSFWLARPSPRYSTVEVRVADAVATVDEAALQAALTVSLARYALTELAAGREAQPIDGQLAAAAIWSAARYGLDGPGIDLRCGRSVATRRLLTELVDLADDSAIDDLVRKVTKRGTGAQRQRRTGEPVAVVDELVALTAMEEK
ncbi:carboxylate-amine ligase [Kibdelosporangium banguiense]|uniref:Putative glutamate--cysteine ligase 2 n=1 Tax=Kibdelosporangium banguiense TaxID=1365924 RepID=A0ABS4TW57_9PSEU|nr:YbdK family carboxylate-amine ligase [Kibdelosporangium banguiense]MBP2328635.1 carboxylate-amine ligase [Kibdelosporangium banguiense]